jgi:hypothetical protein
LQTRDVINSLTTFQVRALVPIRGQHQPSHPQPLTIIFCHVLANGQAFLRILKFFRQFLREIISTPSGLCQWVLHLIIIFDLIIAFSTQESSLDHDKELSVL